MSTQDHSPVSVVIFDRTLLYGSDVPVFSAALKKKINTPTEKSLDGELSPATVSILRSLGTISVSRADSFGGQTNEFAHGIEVIQGTLTSSIHHDEERAVVQPVKYDFSENPTLIRPHRIPSAKNILLSFAHRKGILDRVILTGHPVSLSERLEPIYFLSKRILRNGSKLMSHGSESMEHLVIPAKAGIQSIKLLSPRLRQAFTGVSTEILATLRSHTHHFNLTSIASKTLIAGSMVLMLLTVGPMVALEAESWRQQISFSIKNMASQAVESSYPMATPQVTLVPTPTPDPAPDKQFQVVIPKIGVNSKVIANVDAGNEKEYDAALKLGVAQAKGTGLPGQANPDNKTIFIFGHSTNATWNIARYNALFYSLKDLGVGDQLSVWYIGREYHYMVSERKIIAPNDVSFLIPQIDHEQLILQTCWPPGTSAERLLVIATPSK